MFHVFSANQSIDHLASPASAKQNHLAPVFWGADIPCGRRSPTRACRSCPWSKGDVHGVTIICWMAVSQGTRSGSPCSERLWFGFPFDPLLHCSPSPLCHFIIMFYLPADIERRGQSSAICNPNPMPREPLVDRLQAWLTKNPLHCGIRQPGWWAFLSLSAWAHWTPWPHQDPKHDFTSPQCSRMNVDPGHFPVYRLQRVP
jgi:hypothetical protein